MMEQDKFQKLRNRDITRGIKRMRLDDGDSLPSGKYKPDAEENLKRIGDTEVLDRYHGTAKMSDDDVIREFEPKLSPEHRPGPRPPIDNIPAIYTTPSQDDAADYAFGLSSGAYGLDTKPHLYNVTITPHEIVDLGDCTDNDLIKKAITSGADVIECPKFVEQPETIAFDPKIVHVREAINILSGNKLEVPPKSRNKIPTKQRLVGLPGTSPRYLRDKEGRGRRSLRNR